MNWFAFLIFSLALYCPFASRRACQICDKQKGRKTKPPDTMMRRERVVKLDGKAGKVDNMSGRFNNGTNRGAGKADYGESTETPSYTVKNIRRGRMAGWRIAVETDGRVVYRIVSGYEQKVEKSTDMLYLVIIVQNYKPIGLSFRATKPLVRHFRDKRSGMCLIDLFDLFEK